MFYKLAEALGTAPSVILGRAEAGLADAPSGQNPQTRTDSRSMGTFGKEGQAAIATQIKAEMGAKGWREADLAKAVGMPGSSLNRYLAGVRDFPFPVFAEICLALEVPIPELLERAQRRQDSTPTLAP